MTLEILMATIKQADYSLLEKINLQSDIIVCNQSKNIDVSYKEFKFKEHKVRWYNFSEQGVGLNRNNALFRSNADICLIADDDVTYNSGAIETVVEAFNKNPEADVILFNIFPTADYHPFECRKKMKIGWYNFGRFGGVRIAFRRMSVIKNAISFNTLFGGGCKFSAGEDVMFLRECLRKKLKVIAVPDFILSLRNERASTWYSGWNEKLFRDIGSEYAFLYGKFAVLICGVQLLRHRKEWLISIRFWKAFKYMREGVKVFRKL